MNFGDEAIAKELIARQKEEERDIMNTITIDGESYHFVNTTLDEHGISIFLPDKFIEMEEHLAAKKYISEQRPSLILTDDTTTINFTFELTDIELREEMLHGYLSDYKSALKQLQPANLFYRQSVIEGKSTKIGLIDYTGYAMDGQIYMFVFIVPVMDKMLFCTFSCPEQQKEVWSPVLIDIIKTTTLLPDESTNSYE